MPEILFHVTPEDFFRTDEKWNKYKKRYRPNPPPPNHDWNWRHKAASAVSHTLIALKYKGEIELSVKHHCRGRLGLHSLEGARSFYVDQGFENRGQDPEEMLDYFELTDKALGNEE